MGVARVNNPFTNHSFDPRYTRLGPTAKPNGLKERW
jgi:hypothetical protein